MLQQPCCSNHAGRATNTTVPATVSSIASSSISSAVRSGKEVNAGTGTSAQCGMSRRADSILG